MTKNMTARRSRRRCGAFAAIAARKGQSNMIRVRQSLAFAVLIAGPLQINPLSAQEVKPGERANITIRGIVGASFFVQDALFGLGNGQKAQYVQDDLADDEW